MYGLIVAIAVFATAIFASVLGCESTVAEASSAPIITVDCETGWVPSVMVTLDFDPSVPASARHYAVGKKLGESYTGNKRLYTTPFSVDLEGDVYVRAYYNDAEGAERYVEKKISNVDRTAPSIGDSVVKPDGSIDVDLDVTVDLTSENTLFLRVKLYDALSGIKKGYIAELTKYDDETAGMLERLAESSEVYGGDITALLGRSATIVAVDYAGNIKRFQLSLGGYNESIIREYRQKYAAIDFSEYSEGGADEVRRAFSRLSLELTARNIDNTTARTLAHEADEAIAGALTVTKTVSSKPSSDMILDFSIQADTDKLDVKKGEALTLDIYKSSFDGSESVYSAAGVASGYHSYDVFTFGIGIRSSEGDVNILKSLPVTVSIPNGRFPVQVYRISQDGSLVKLSSTIDEDNMTVTFYTDRAGDFTIVGVKPYEQERGAGITVDGKFYSVDLILTAVGIVVGVAVAAGVITFVIMYIIKRRRR